MAPKPLDETELYQAALNHLARYAATRAGLARVLGRRVERWARQQAEPGADAGQIAAVQRDSAQMIANVIARLQAANLVDDTAFALARASRLTRAGKSRRHTLAHLAAKGVATATAAALLADDPEQEIAAACAYLKRRRAGPFGPAAIPKTLAAMARAGFSQATARAALSMAREEAEARIKQLRA